MTKAILVLIFLVAASAVSLRVSFAQKAGDFQPPADAAIKLKGLDGKLYDTSDMRGQVVMASFGATWCVPCVWELKAVEELIEEYKGKPVRFLWVSIEERERTSDTMLRNYVKMYRLTLPVLRDETGATFSQFSTNRRIPLAAFFDKEGRLALPLHRGMPSDPIKYKEMVRKRLNSLLAEGEGAKEAKGTQ